MTTTETEERLVERLDRLAAFARTEPTRSLDARSVVLLDLEPARRRSRIPATVAAGVVAVAAIGSVVVVAERSGSGPRDGITATSPFDGTSFDQGATPPDVALTGWSKTDSTSSVVPPSPVGDHLFYVLADEANPFEGPRISVGVASPPASWPGPTSNHVDLNGAKVAVGTAGDRTFVAWSPAPRRIVYLEGTGTTTDQLLGVARGVQVSSGASTLTIDAGAVPAGMQAIKAGEVVTDPVVRAETTFERDGVRLKVTLDGGGRAALEHRLDGSERTVTVRGQQGALHTDDGRNFELLFADGRWAVEISGGPFAGEQAFFEAVDSLVVTPAG
jgi:hypothetical protein